MIQPEDLTRKNHEQAEKSSRQEERISQQENQIQELLIRVDKLTNAVALLKEENQTLRDEIANLKKQKPRPKIPPSSLEGSKSGDKKGKSKPSMIGAGPAILRFECF